jgi:hypothetical protein
MKWRALTERPIAAACDVVLLMDDSTEVEGEYLAPSQSVESTASGFAWDGIDLRDPALPVKWRQR